MAGTAKTLRITRPNESTLDATGEVYEASIADYLDAEVDLYSNGLIIVQARLQFADYTGLEAEWVAGTDTTVLEDALDDYLTNTLDPADEELTSAQRSFITGYSIERT